jgi:hypothetical protein
MSGCGTRPNKPLKTWLVAELKQSSPSSHFFCALRLAVRGFKVKTMRMRAKIDTLEAAWILPRRTYIFNLL